MRIVHLIKDCAFLLSLVMSSIRKQRVNKLLLYKQQQKVDDQRNAQKNCISALCIYCWWYFFFQLNFHISLFFFAIFLFSHHLQLTYFLHVLLVISHCYSSSPLPIKCEIFHFVISSIENIARINLRKKNTN